MEIYYTKEMLSEIENFNFYIKDDIGVSLMNNNVITITKNNIHEHYYDVSINNTMYNRIIKIYQITKNEKLKDILKIIQLCWKNKILYHEIIQDQLVNELSMTINKEIIKKLYELRDTNIK